MVYYQYMTLKNFIEKRPYLVWHTRNYARLSEGAVVEAVLQYGDFSDVQKLIRLLSMQKVARIFRTHARRSRSNYDARTKNYFTLYFKKHVHKK